MITTKKQWMTTGNKTLRGAVILFACTVWLTSSTAWAQSTGIHPDGQSTSYRGWGPTVLTADGYTCTLFESHGVRVGSATFHVDGRMDLTLGTEQAHFVAAQIGITTFSPIDVASFPSIPTRLRSDSYQLMVFAARFAVGQNLIVNAPVTGLANSISVIEARCVYVVDRAGNVLFCLNCIFTAS